MKVSELITLLSTFPQDLTVVYKCYSEQHTMHPNELSVEKHCKARPDGWVQNARADKELEEYLCFPGN